MCFDLSSRSAFTAALAWGAGSLYLCSLQNERVGFTHSLEIPYSFALCIIARFSHCCKGLISLKILLLTALIFQALQNYHAQCLLIFKLLPVCSNNTEYKRIPICLFQSQLFFSFKIASMNMTVSNLPVSLFARTFSMISSCLNRPIAMRVAWNDVSAALGAWECWNCSSKFRRT